MLSVGLVGLGIMGLQHAAIVNALPTARISAVSEVDSFMSRVAKAVMPEVKVFSDYTDMLHQTQLDAVYITTQLSTHAKIIRGIADEQLPLGIFVEKPLASSSQECDSILGATRKTRGKTMVGFQRRFSGTFRKGKEYLDSCILGEAQYFRGHSYSPDILGRGKGTKFEPNGGGAILELGIHLIDIITWYFGEPSWAVTFTKNVFNEKVEDFAHSMLEFDNGLRGYIDVSWSMRNFKPSELMIEIHGTEGMMTISDDRLIVHLDRAKTTAGIPKDFVLFSSDLTPPVHFLMSYPEYSLEDAHFIECLLKGQDPIVTFKEGSKTNRVADMILKGRSVGHF